MSAFFTTVMGWFGSSTIKWVAYGALALTITGTIGGGYVYLTHLDDKYAESQKELAIQKLSTQLANERAAATEAAHNDQIERLQALEGARTDLADQVSQLHATIDQMNLEQEIQSAQPETAVTHLNGRHADLNRMLERASRNAGTGAPVAGNQAGAPSGP